MRLLLLLLPLQTWAFYHNMPMPETDKEAVQGVITRLPSWVNRRIREIKINESLRGDTGESVEIRPVDRGDSITVEGGSGSAVLYGINYYLRHHCRLMVTWDQVANRTENCSELNQTVKFEAPKVRYFGNPCTFGYSFPWWKWPEWEKFIDWLALNGFNMVLAPIGQEAIWRDLFTYDFKLTEDAMRNYFPAPAYLPWHRMGNLKKLGGPLSDTYLNVQLALNKLIVARLASLGIAPVLPTFAGFVPDGIFDVDSSPEWKKKFVRNACWGNFTGENSCLLSVRPNDNLWGTIVTSFMDRQKAEYGKLYHYYSADPMNEIASRLDNLQYLRDLANSMHMALQNYDKDYIWVLQSWTFSYDQWPKQSVKAFLGGVPLGNLLVLDVYAEHTPLYHKYKSFYGHAFVWSMLHNFGGNTELRGNLKRVNRAYGLVELAENSMVGAGMTMEAIHQNYIQYQFMIDRMWSRLPLKIVQWIDGYVDSRYQGRHPNITLSWHIASETFYNEPIHEPNALGYGGRFENFVYKRPRLMQTTRYWFDLERLQEIVYHFDRAYEMDIFRNDELFMMDYRDFHRELLQIQIGNDYIMRIAEAVALDEEWRLSQACDAVPEKFEQLDKLANYHLDDWEETAKTCGFGNTEEHRFQVSARMLLSTWGPKGEILDYAHRGWSGLINRYYSKRWDHLCGFLTNPDNNLNMTLFDIGLASMERTFAIVGRLEAHHNLFPLRF